MNSHDLAADFLRSISGKLLRKRFPDLGSWRPTLTSLCLVDGRAVALADAVVFPNGTQAEFGLIARQSYGAHAVRALQRLKASAKVANWMTSLGTVSPATIAISRLYADVTFDQATIEVKAAGDRRFGSPIHAQPTTLLASRSMMKARELPPLQNWDYASKQQVRWAIGNVGADILDPTGSPLGSDVLPLFFDVFGIEMIARQHFSRFTMHGIVAQHGIDLRRLPPKSHMDPAILKGLVSKMSAMAGQPFPRGGIFRLQSGDA